MQAAATTAVILATATPAFAHNVNVSGEANAELRGLSLGRLTAALRHQYNDERKELQKQFKEERRQLKTRLVEAQVQITEAMRMCIKPAVEKRETAIGAAFGAYTTSATTALTARKTALLAAWDLTDATARQTAIRTAWKTYRDATQTARKTLRAARVSAWTQFATDVKACGATLSASSEASHSMEIDE